MSVLTRATWHNIPEDCIFQEDLLLEEVVKSGEEVSIAGSS
jgi:hypothetical protein